MRRLLLVVSIALLLFPTRPALAGPGSEHLVWGSHVTPAQCPLDQGYRYLEINVTHRVTNDPDLVNDVSDPTVVRQWAVLEYNRHIQIWKVGVSDPPGQGERFCALVKYQGSWVTVAGASPGGTSILPAGIDGTFEGGYRMVFTAEEVGAPAYRRRGNVGAFNYATQPAFDWLGTYFTNVSGQTIEWWGWVYHGGHNGTWVNACDPGQSSECPGNGGDITP